MNELAPTRKISAAALSGAISAVVVWVLNGFVLSKGNQVTGEVAASVTTLVTFLVGYVVPDSEPIDVGVAWSRMEHELRDPNFDWRSIEALASAAAISKTDAKRILRRRNDVQFGWKMLGGRSKYCAKIR